MIVIAAKCCESDRETLHKTAHILGDELLYAADKHNIKLSVSKNGRPITNDDSCDISFSHSGFLAVAALFLADGEMCVNITNCDFFKKYDISAERIGVDAELINELKPIENIKSIAERYFLPNENLYLNESDSTSEFYKRFYFVWTRKESICKMTGEGLSGFSKADALCDAEYQIITEIITLNKECYALSICAGK